VVPTLIIVFREILEAALVVGIVMAATKGVPRRGLWVGGGIVAGALGAVMVAAFADAIANAVEGMGQEIFNACILFAAVVMLGWHNVWMGRHGRALAVEMDAVGGAVREGSRPLYALALVVAIAVLREGSEIVLFLYGIAVASQAGAMPMLTGGALGLAAGVAVGLVIYFGLLRLPIGSLFAATTALILFLAAGMAAQGAAFLNQAGILPTLGNSVWNTSGLISDQSAVGQVLHVLIGYTAEPSGIQIVFYLATLAAITGLMWLMRAPPTTAHAAA
jgi:high-affinity iron transporter